ncbi:hypothetical protein [Massilia sp. S19_KUP03_FR1]|uniref:hypothetical protein n=1 Tax=Massilia sp. S19_KUP03_FR1 TaxID=3025503 RepID=UPI002FCDC1AF
MSDQLTAAKADLISFGFNVLFDPDGSAAAARWFSLAVREFQMYATRPLVAREKSGSGSKLRGI